MGLESLIRTGKRFYQFIRLLIVEDEKQDAISLAKVLVKSGYAVDLADNAEKALELLALYEYDLITLDLNLPDMDGLEVCRLARAQKPTLLILILSAHVGIDNIVTSLDSGADDYLTKPFHAKEILARIRALLRRDMRCREPMLRINGLCLDPAEQVIWKGKQRLHLTPKEFGILEYLMRHAGEVISQEQLLEHVWGTRVNIFSNTVRVHIQSLRKKLGDTSENPQIITTVMGSGYRYSPPEEFDEEKS